MNDRQTGVMIVRASRAGDVTTTELRLTEGKWPTPVAPASVRRDAPESGVVTELHRLTDLSGPSATFESYGIETPSRLRAAHSASSRGGRRTSSRLRSILLSTGSCAPTTGQTTTTAA